MNDSIDLRSLLSGAGKGHTEQLVLFALINLGIVESLTNGLISASDTLQFFFHADNCLFVRNELRAEVADEIMSRGVQLADLFEALPADEAQREFYRELAELRALCLKLLEQKRSAA